MKITQLIVVAILITTSLNTPVALAEECQVSACVDVYTQDGKIIIEGRKGGTTAVTPAPTVKAIPKKVAPKKVAPPPVKKKVAPPKPTVTKKAIPKKSTPTPQPPVAQTASLNDRLIKALPTA